MFEALRELNGEELAAKLKSRRESLVGHAKAFYRAIKEKPLLSEPLKGSEDLNLNEGLFKMF